MAKIFLTALWQQRRKQHIRRLEEANAVWAEMLSLEAEAISLGLSLKTCNLRVCLERQGMQDSHTGCMQRLRGKAGKTKEGKASQRVDRQHGSVQEQSPPGSAGTAASS